MFLSSPLNHIQTCDRQNRPASPAPLARTVPHTPSALMVADVHVFRHEFITQFRYSHRATVHPADMHILEPIADGATLYEEDKGTVFLARDVMAQLQKLTALARGPVRRPHARTPSRPLRMAKMA